MSDGRSNDQRPFDSAQGRPAISDRLVVLGVDPGLRVTGWGVVATGDSGVRSLATGTVTLRGERPPAERLHHIFQELCAVIERWRPVEVAVEDPFVGDNARSALAIGEARAVALLAAAQAGLPAWPYAPAEVKLAVAGHGRSDKSQVGELVRIQLGLAEAPRPADAADALAVALCHILRRQADARLASAR